MMRPIATLVVDDEPAARKALRHLLAPDPEITVVAECRSGWEAIRAIRERRPELLLLDIQMPGLDGFGLLRELEADELPVVLFVTAYDQYVLQAFDVHAVDYLLKPFSDARFAAALREAKRQVQHKRLGDLGQEVAALLAQYVGLLEDVRSPTDASRPAPSPPVDRLLITVGGRITPVRAGDIDWIDAEGDYVRLHVGGAAHVVRATMDKIAGRLDPTQFVRIHRSTIVNVDRVKQLQPCYRGEYVAVLTEGTTLKVSRARREAVASRLGRSA